MLSSFRQRCLCALSMSLHGRLDCMPCRVNDGRIFQENAENLPLPPSPPQPPDGNTPIQVFAQVVNAFAAEVLELEVLGRRVEGDYDDDAGLSTEVGRSVCPMISLVLYHVSFLSLESIPCSLSARRKPYTIAMRCDGIRYDTHCVFCIAWRRIWRWNDRCTAGRSVCLLVGGFVVDWFIVDWLVDWLVCWYVG